MKYLSSIDLNKNQIKNVVIDKLADYPSSPVDGQIFYHNGDLAYYVRIDGAWVDLRNANFLGGTAYTAYALKASPAFTGTPTAPTAGSGTNTTQLATTAFVVTEIAARLASNDAMTYKGAIDCSSNPNYPAANAGDTYRISVGGKIGGVAGASVEAGDMIICHVDSSTSGAHISAGPNWDIIQTNIDGAVTLTGTQTLTNKTLTNPTIGSFVNATHTHRDATGGGVLDMRAINMSGDPSGSTGNVASGVHGLVPAGIDDATYFLSSSTTPNWAVVTDAVIGFTDITTNNASTTKHGFLRKLDNNASHFLNGQGNWATPSGGTTGTVMVYSENVGNGTTTSFSITHGLNSIDPVVQVKDNATGEYVYTNVVYVDENHTDVTFAVAPTSNQYRVIIMGANDA